MMPVNLKRYAMAYVACVAALAAISVGMQAFLNVPAPSGLSTVLPPMLAAMLEGQKAAEAQAPAYTKPEAWAQARRMTGVAAVINVVIAAAYLFIAEVRETVLSAPLIFLVILIFALVIVLLANRFALTLGYRSFSKAKARKKGE